MKVRVTVKRRGQLNRQFIGLFACTIDAIVSVLGVVGDEPCSISAEVLA